MSNKQRTWLFSTLICYLTISFVDNPFNILALVSWKLTRHTVYNVLKYRYDDKENLLFLFDFFSYFLLPCIFLIIFLRLFFQIAANSSCLSSQIYLFFFHVDNSLNVFFYFLLMPFCKSVGFFMKFF